MTSVELLLRARLVRDALWLVLTEAGFLVRQRQDEHDRDKIVIIDLEDCRDPEKLQLYQSHGVKIVALTSEADSREMERDEIAALSGILTYDLRAAAFVRSLRLIISGERLFPYGFTIGKRSAAADATVAPVVFTFLLARKK